MAPQSSAVAANLALLEQGHDLLGRLPESVFAGGAAGAQPVGPQFRHVIEHYSCFLAGLASGRVDYDARPREQALETDREAARRRIRDLADGLAALPAEALEAEAEVRLECGIGDEREQWSRSTMRRELHFLLSHTVHHYAIIGLQLARHGIDPGSEFGVAPSTLKHWGAQVACAPQAG
jgi:hypothetical protein